MKPARALTYRLVPLPAPILPALALLALSANPAVAETYDANTGTAGVQDGAGAGWNTSNINWWNGTSDVVWPNTTSSTAIFGGGGTGASVTVGTVNVGTIQFNPIVTTAYTLAAGTITLGAGITNTNTVGTSIISSKITGSAGLAYVGTGTAAVSLTSSTSDYTGLTTLSTAGRLTVGHENALGSNAGASASTLGSNYTQINTGTSVSLNKGNVSFNEAFIINGAGSGGTSGAIRVLQNNATLGSLVQLGSSSRIDVNGAAGFTISGNVELGANTLTMNNASTAMTFSGVISGSSGSLTITNAGTAFHNITNNSNSFSGTTTTARVIGIGGNNVLGTSNLVLQSGAGLQSTDGTARTIGNVITSIANAGVSLGQTTIQTGTLAFTNMGATTITGTSTLTTNVATSFANGFTSTGGITKTGAADLTFSGANDYSGATNVNAGKLLINGTNSGSGVVNVGASGTLGGIGAIAGGINVTGVLAPGASIESLATGAVAFLTSSKLSYELQDTSSTGADLVDITGNLSLAGTVTLDLVKLGGATWTFGDKLTLLSYTGTLTANSFFNFADGGDGKLTDDEIFSFDGAQWAFNYNDDVAGSNYNGESSGAFVTMTVIPEPNVAILAGGLGVLVLVRRRRHL